MLVNMRYRAGTGSLLGLWYGVQRIFCDGVCVIQK